MGERPNPIGTLGGSRTARWIGFITLAGLGLRVWQIWTLGDLDFDEQASGYIGSMDPAPMIGYLVHAPFEHPPLFYLLFHYWLRVFGSGETAMRLFSVVPGTLTILVLGLTLARAAGSRAGIVAALVVALSPLQIYESRDARMYSLLSLLMACLLAAITWRMPVVLDGGPREPSNTERPANRRRAWIVAILVSLAALGTHYYAFFGLVGLVVGAQLARRLGDPADVAARTFSLSREGGMRALRSGATASDGPAPSPPPGERGTERALGAPALGLAGAAILFIVLAAGWVSAAPGLRTSLTTAYPRLVDPRVLAASLASSFGASIAGPLAPPDEAVLAGIGMMVAVAGTGLLVARPGRGAAPRSVAATEPSPGLALAADLASRRRVSLIAISAFLLPTVAVPLLMIIGRAYAPRFVTLATPFLAALLGVAATAVPRRAAVAAGVVIAGVSLAFLSPAYAGYMRSDYGAAMAALRAHVQPDDAIVLNGPWQDLLYRRYGWGLPDRYIIASTVPLIPAESIGWLERLTSSHSRLWVVDSATDAADPTGVVTGWLDAHAYPAPVFQFEKAVLRPYLVSETDPLRERVVDASTLDLRIRSVASDRWAARPGDWARLRIRGTTVVAGDGDALQGASDTGGGDRLFVELDGPDGTDVWHWDGPLEARAGETEYRAAIVVPEGAATGAYTLSAVAYQQGRSGQVVRIGDSVALTTIDVRR